MKASLIHIGAWYRHKTSEIGFARALQVIPPKTDENTTTCTLVKCAWSTTPTSQAFELRKYFKASELTPYTSGVPVTQPVQQKDAK